MPSSCVASAAMSADSAATWLDRASPLPAEYADCLRESNVVLWSAALWTPIRSVVTRERLEAT